MCSTLIFQLFSLFYRYEVHCDWYVSRVNLPAILELHFNQNKNHIQLSIQNTLLTYHWKVLCWLKFSRNTDLGWYFPHSDYSGTISFHLRSLVIEKEAREFVSCWSIEMLCLCLGSHFTGPGLRSKPTDLHRDLNTFLSHTYWIYSSRWYLDTTYTTRQRLGKDVKW